MIQGRSLGGILKTQILNIMNQAQNNHGDDHMILTLSKDLGSESGHDKTLVHKKPVSLVWASDVSSLKKNGLSMKMSFFFVI